MKETLSYEEASEYLGVSGSSFDDLICSGVVPGAKISQRWVFRKDDLDAYLIEQVRIQTEARREAWRNGVPAKVKTAVAEVRRGKRRVVPTLPDLPMAA